MMPAFVHNAQQVIDWIDEMAARGNLFAGDLRQGRDFLVATAAPRPQVVDEKISAWSWLLDNNQVPEAPAGSQPAEESSPLMLIGVLVLGYFLFGRKR